MKKVYKAGDLLKFINDSTFVGTLLGHKVFETNDTLLGPYPAGYLVIFFEDLIPSDVDRFKILIDGQIGWVYEYETDYVQGTEDYPQ
jgi:hypothetical protein